MSKHDVIIIGAGHNGLVAAAYLAKAGKRVLVLERRGVVGGSAVTEDFGSGFKVDPVWTGGALRPQIARDLGLPLPANVRRDAIPPFRSLLDAGREFIPTHLELPADPVKAAECLKPFSEKDVALGQVIASGTGTFAASRAGCFRARRRRCGRRTRRAARRA